LEYFTELYKKDGSGYTLSEGNITEFNRIWWA